MVLIGVSLVTYSSEHLCLLFCLVMHILKAFASLKIVAISAFEVLFFF